MEHLGRKPHAAGVFSAGVADYAPREVKTGKTPSGDDDWPLTLSPVPKVIDEVRAAFPELDMVTFKYQEGMSHEELMMIARARLDQTPPSSPIAERNEVRTVSRWLISSPPTANPNVWWANWRSPARSPIISKNV